MDTTTRLDGIDGRGTGENAFDAARARGLGGGMRSIADDAVPAVEQGLDRAQSLIDRGMTTVDDLVASLRAKADEVGGQVEAYTRQQPVNALLIAGFVGAAAMGLLSMMARRR